eukprot:COSAG01_NODE_1837_length_9083_cov_143.534617_2_plen_1123_part_00
MSLLSALDSLSENFVDRVEVLLTALQEGGEEAVVALARVLEHALSVLEALRMSTPRRGRKLITVMSDGVEKLLDTMDENDLISQIAACEASCLVVLVERLCAVEALSEVEAGDTADAIACVEAMVDKVERCGDPVATASRMLGSNAVRQRAQGLAVLSALPRVVLEEACDAEVACVSLVMDLSQDSRHDIAERTLAASAQFTLCLRNTAIPPDVDGFVAHVRSAHKEWINASPGDIGAASEFLLNVDLTALLYFDMAPQLSMSQSPVLALAERFCVSLIGKGLQGTEFSKLLTADQCQRLLPCITEMLTHEDSDLLASAFHIFGCYVAYSQATLTPILMIPSVIDAIVAGIQSVWDPHKDVSWWKKRCGQVNVDTMRLSGTLMLPCQLSHRCNDIPAAVEARWDELIDMSVELVKMNQRAQLSAKASMPTMVFYFAFRLISKQASFAQKRKGLLASGVVEALLYASVHGSPIALGEITTTASAAAGAVQLIGRNEGGLTLCREVVHAVLDAFGCFFDSTKRHFTALASRAVADSWSITHMAVSDANKAFIVEHPSAIDNLVTGLLLEEDNPRRGQPGAAELQHACALALQNLALSAIGAGPLRARGRVMEALHKLAEVGMTEEARRCASGALFELETERRQTELSSVAADEHIMLSYNWDCQAVIKRVHASLVRRGYTTWIDVEKMQGSTVEAMADAVECAAVMCYGISRAYKESTNCRLEAQYAFQREKDMVPLMVEEGYRADGWLGMLLGTRLYYVFFGSTLSSDAAFEGKMEELCRELGERGKGFSTQVSALPQIQLTLQQLCDEAQRVSALVQCLECSARLLPAVPRQQRAALSMRVDLMQDMLEEGEQLAPSWIEAEWTAEQCEAVGESVARVVSLEGTPEAGEGPKVVSAVTSLLSALDSVSESFVDRADALLAALQNGDESGAGALAGVLEHGVAVLEALWTSTPRRGRKRIGTTSERVEELLESMDDNESGGLKMISQLSSCEESSLAMLCKQLCAVEALRVGDAGVDVGSAVACMEALLEELGQCTDPVMGASRRLVSREVEQRLQGLSVLSALPRVVLVDACNVEVECMDVVMGMLSKEGGAECSGTDFGGAVAVCVVHAKHIHTCGLRDVD